MQKKYRPTFKHQPLPRSIRINSRKDICYSERTYIGQNQINSSKGEINQITCVSWYRSIKERLEAIEKAAIHDPRDAIKICLVPDVVISKNFNVP